MLKQLYAFLRWFHMDQRGEVGDDIDPNPDPDDNSMVSDIDDPDFSPGDDPQDNPDDSPDDDPDKDPDEGPDKKPDTDDPLEKLRTELTEDFNTKLAAKDKEINRLGYALRTANKEKVEEKGDDAQFTDAQLLSIMQEHKDDPTVLLQVMKEISKTSGKEIEKSAATAADIKTKSVQMDEFLTHQFPETLKDDTEQHQAVEKAIDWLHLKDHPFARYLAIGAMQMQQLPKLIEKIKADAKKEALGKTADEIRKKNIKTQTPGSKGKGDGDKLVALSQSQKETAQKLFPGDKKLQARYARMVGKKQATITASVQ